MSLHRKIDQTEWRGEGDDREYIVQTLCECGWEGDEHSDKGHTAHDRARRDYRAHVEDALGPEAYYTATVACRNCGSEHEQGVLIGTHVYEGACQRCGTHMLQPSNDAWHESREQSRRWLG